MAWKQGVKSLYYCRSLSIQRADNVSEKREKESMLTPAVANDADNPLPMAASSSNYEECLACQ